MSDKIICNSENFDNVINCPYLTQKDKNFNLFTNNAEFPNLSYIFSEYHNNISFQNCHFKKSLIVNGEKANNSTYPSFYNAKCHFDGNILIMGGEKKDETIFFKKIGFHAPAFDKNNSELFLQNLKIEELELSYFTNNAKTFRFIDVEVTGKLTITHSTLTDMEFNGLDLSKCDKIIIKNSSFHNVLFNNVNWGEINSTRFKNSDEEDAPSVNRDTFRQLKHVNETQGNHIQANEFYRMEMKRYKEEIKDKKTNLKDRIVFSISENLSNFSQDWILPILWYINLGLFLFLMFLPSFSAVVLGIILLLPFIITENNYKIHITVLSIVMYIIFTQVSNIAYSYLDFINPFITIFPINETNIQKLSIAHGIFKILSIFIGYHIYTSLHAKTRRK